MRRTAILLAAAAMALGAAGCSDSTSPKNLAYGRYALVSVNGEALPVTLFDVPSLTLKLTDGALTLKPNSTFTEEATLDVVSNGFPAPSEHLSCGGTFTRSGDTFTMTGIETENCSGVTATGVLDGNTLTVSDDQGETLVFRR